MNLVIMLYFQLLTLKLIGQTETNLHANTPSPKADWLTLFNKGTQLFWCNDIYYISYTVLIVLFAVKKKGLEVYFVLFLKIPNPS